MVDDAGTLIDMHTRDTFDYVSDVCDLLNEQHETIQRLKQNITELLSVNVEEELLKENEQLKQAYTQLKHRHSLLHDVCIDAECDRDSYRKDIASLEKENEQLKTTIQQLTNDNTKQKKKLNTAMKENEQLKCGNKNLKAILNDFINICNRLQSNPTDKQTLGVARDMLQNMGKELEE